MLLKLYCALSLLILTGCSYVLVSKPEKIAYFNTLNANKSDYEQELAVFCQDNGLKLQSIGEVAPGLRCHPT